MHAKCTVCGKEMTVQAVCTSDVWPLGWQIALSRNGEHWFCSHTCAAAWHQAQANYESPLLSGSRPESRGTAYPTPATPMPLNSRPC